VKGLPLAVALAVALAAASSAHAQLFMAWNACDGTPGSSTSNINFDCDPLSTENVELWGTYGLPATASGAVAFEGIIDFAFQGETSVPPFWHFERGGCNELGLVYAYAPGIDTTFCSLSNSNALMGGRFGNDGFGEITAYFNGTQVPLGGPNRARMLILNARHAAAPPATLPGMPTRNFGFHISFLMAGASGATCGGCGVPTAIAWNQLVVYNNSARGGSEGLLAIISSSTPGSTATLPINGATISVATARKSWGQLKALYR
jgi:hypothetical protein